MKNMNLSLQLQRPGTAAPAPWRCRVLALGALLAMAVGPASAADTDTAATEPESAYTLFDRIMIATSAGEAALARKGGTGRGDAALAAVAADTAALDAMAAAGNAEAALYGAVLQKRKCLALSADAPPEVLADDAGCLREAFARFRIAAEAGDPIAMRQLAEFHEVGYGVPPSTEDAVTWLVDAASAELDRGKYEYASNDLDHALVLDPQHRQALTLRRKILGAGSARAR